MQSRCNSAGMEKSWGEIWKRAWGCAIFANKGDNTRNAMKTRQHIFKLSMTFLFQPRLKRLHDGTNLRKYQWVIFVLLGIIQSCGNNGHREVAQDSIPVSEEEVVGKLSEYVSPLTDRAIDSLYRLHRKITTASLLGDIEMTEIEFRMKYIFKVYPVGDSLIMHYSFCKDHNYAEVVYNGNPYDTIPPMQALPEDLSNDIILSFMELANENLLSVKDDEPSKFDRDFEAVVTLTDKDGRKVKGRIPRTRKRNLLEYYLFCGAADDLNESLKFYRGEEVWELCGPAEAYPYVHYLDSLEKRYMRYR